jgi:hypothetical protein
MAHDLKSNLWPNTTDAFFRDHEFNPVKQSGKHCVSTSLAMLTKQKPEDFQNEKVNTQNPHSWSEALRPFEMQLAYCPSDVRKLKFYMKELLELNDLFLLCYYSPADDSILKDPDDKGWVCGSHVVILHRDKILDPKHGNVTEATKHECNEHYTKRLFRVVPVDHSRRL